MRLAPWSSRDTDIDEDTPLLHSHEDSATTRSGLLTNLVSQDTYNIMSCVWICHYIWAIPLKVLNYSTILYDNHTSYSMSYIFSNIHNLCFVLGSCYIVLIVQEIRNECNHRNSSKCVYHNTLAVLHWI